jgi:hypothetical protein
MALPQSNKQLPRNILVINFTVLIGLGYQYFRGAPMVALVVSAVILLALVNLIFLFRIRKAKREL